MSTDNGTIAKRERRPQDVVAAEKFNEHLDAMPFEDKVELIKRLKEEVNIEVVNRKAAADQATSLTNGL